MHPQRLYMRITYVINTFGCGGAERHLLLLVGYMASLGHTVLVIALSDKIRGGAKDLKSDFYATGAQIIVLGRTNSGLLIRSASIFRLLCIIKSFSPDLVHSHLPRADFISSFFKYICPNILWVSTVHDAYVKGVFSGYWLIPLLGWRWRGCDQIIAVSSYVRSWLMNTLMVQGQICTIISHGILLPSIKPKTSAARHTPFTIGCMARYEPRKGIATLIQAVSLLSRRGNSVRLLVSGSDPNGYSADLKRMAQELGVNENVDILGFSEDPLVFLSMLDVFALASSCEGFGIVILEAMASQLPVVASNILPFNQIVINGVTGFLPDHNDASSFAQAFQTLVEYPELRERMGKAGLARCTESFSLKAMLQSTEDIYKDLLIKDSLFS